MPPQTHQVWLRVSPSASLPRGALLRGKWWPLAAWADRPIACSLLMQFQAVPRPPPQQALGASQQDIVAGPRPATEGLAFSGSSCQLQVRPGGVWVKPVPFTCPQTACYSGWGASENKGQRHRGLAYRTADTPGSLQPALLTSPLLLSWPQPITNQPSAASLHPWAGLRVPGTASGRLWRGSF